MSDTTALADVIRSLTKDTAVTLTLADGSTHEARVRSVNQSHDGDHVSVHLWDDEYKKSRLTLTALEGVSVKYNPPECHVADDGDTVVDVETHGIVVDQNEPVTNSKIADCPVCGGLMPKVWGDMKESFDYYKCRDCDNEETYQRSDDATRSPTRREWVELELNSPNPYTIVPERYLLDDEEPIGFYYKEECPEGHYKRCEVGEKGNPRTAGVKDDDIEVCPDCGRDTDKLVKTYAEGMDEWGEPETFGGDIPEKLTNAINAVRTGEVALKLSIPAGDIGRQYEEAYLVKKDDRIGIDIVNGGCPMLHGTAGGIGRVAYWFNQTENPELIPILQYEEATDSAAA